MKLSKWVTAVTIGSLTIGVTPIILTTSTSCGHDIENIQLFNKQDAVLNQATYTFSCTEFIPDTIQLVWFTDKETAQQLKIVDGNEIPVDQHSHSFDVNFEVMTPPDEWTDINFGLYFQYEVNGEAMRSSIKTMTLHNGTTPTDFIDPNYSRTKLITSIRDDAVFSFYFDPSKSPFVPEKIDQVYLINVPKKFENIVALHKTHDIEINPISGEIQIPIGLNQSTDEAPTFSLVLLYDYEGQKICYYTERLSLIYDNQTDDNKKFLTLTATNGTGDIYYTNTNTESTIEKDVFYRINKTNYWSYLSINQRIYVNEGDVIEIAGLNDTWSDRNNQFHFVIENVSVDLSGSPESLLHAGSIANTLSGDYCFYKLFMDNPTINHVDPNFLPMHALSEHCYDSMFRNCSNLTCEEFNLPAKILKSFCYRQMFYNTGIKSIKYFSNDALSETISFQWLEGCRSLESVSIPSDVDTSSMQWTTSTIPSQDLLQTFNEPLTVVAQKSGQITLIGYDEKDFVDVHYVVPEKDIKYSLNYPDEQFKDINLYEESITLNEGEYVYFQGENPEGWYNKSTGDTHHIGFCIRCISDLHGSIMSLIDPTLQIKKIPHDENAMAGFPCLFSSSYIKAIGSKVFDIEDCLPNNCFRSTFYGCSNLTDLGKIIELIKTLKLYPNCCEGMFVSCHSLTDIGTDDMVPTEFADYCFHSMFESCVQLQKAPLVTNNEKDMKPHCLEDMFKNCADMQYAQPIISKSAAPYCYAGMFDGCTDLCIQAGTPCPETDCYNIGEEDEYCFSKMYRNCKSIRDIPMLKKHTWPAGACQSMFEGCSSLTSYADSENYICFTKSKLFGPCFNKMFFNCPNLQHIHIDLDNWGEDFIDFVDDSNVTFENWLKKPIYGSVMYLRNKGNLDIDDLPLVFKPDGWIVETVTSTTFLKSTNAEGYCSKYEN